MGPPATPQDISTLRTRFPRAPEEYVQLSLEASEIELDFQGKYLRIWHPRTCLDMDDGYNISARLPGAVPIGDDGGGRLLFYLDGKEGWGLYRVGYGDLDADDAVRVATSLRELLSTGTGMQIL